VIFTFTWSEVLLGILDLPGLGLGSDTACPDLDIK
jgi:hypothetical protein